MAIPWLLFELFTMYRNWHLSYLFKTKSIEGDELEPQQERLENQRSFIEGLVFGERRDGDEEGEGMNGGGGGGGGNVLELRRRTESAVFVSEREHPRLLLQSEKNRERPEETPRHIAKQKNQKKQKRHSSILFHRGREPEMRAPSTDPIPQRPGRLSRRTKSRCEAVELPFSLSLVLSRAFSLFSLSLS